MVGTKVSHVAELGSSIPAFTRHAISVSLPHWQDVVDYGLGLERVLNTLHGGYPRSFIHHDIQKLADNCQATYGETIQERCILFPSEKAANQCMEFIAHQSQDVLSHLGSKKAGRVVSLQNCLSKSSALVGHRWQSELRIFLLFVPDGQAFTVARTFWQYTGLGISSRCAVRILQLLTVCPIREAPRIPLDPLRPNSKYLPPIAYLSHNQKGSARYKLKQNSKLPLTIAPIHTNGEIDENTPAYLEDFKDIGWQKEQAHGVKLTIRRRIADILVDKNSDGTQNLGESHRGAGDLKESDIYLYPNGMSAIFCAYQLSMSLRARLHPNLPVGKSVCFGFPYADTLKMLEKWGPGVHFFGHGEMLDLEALEKMLHDNRIKCAAPIVALFCEFPSNPLLKSPDLARLRSLADQYGFVIIIDDTIGNFVNVDVLPHSDILVSSLTKTFSGECTVMGGSMVINPSCRYHEALKRILDGDAIQPSGLYEDIYFEDDAIQMEINSRDMRARVKQINQNAEGLCEYLKSLIDSDENKIIKSIHYPRYTTPENYETCRRKHSPGGYGGLFSITFNDTKSCETFYDNLDSLKGPSAGTNFTLACPYVILAHFHEREWVKQFGVDSNLIRVSVGLEDFSVISKRFQFAFERANI